MGPSLTQPESRPRTGLLFSVVGPYLLAVIGVAAALGLRLLLSAAIGNRSPYFLFAFAVLVAASYGGRGPGLLATALGALTGSYFFGHPRYSLQIAWPDEAIPLGSFILIGLGATLFSDRLRSARRNAEIVAARNQEFLEKYRYNLEAAKAGTFDWNIATGEVQWSNNMEAIHGQPPGTFGGTMDGVLEFIHPDDRDMVRENIRRAIEGEGNYQVECRHFRADGTVGWMERKGRVIYDERTRQPIRMIGVCIDATERKRNEQAHLQLAAIVDSSEDAIISADMTGRILTWNAAAERMYGYPAAEIIGRDMTVLLSSGCAARKGDILGMVARGEHIQHFEALCTHKTGRPIWVSLTISRIGGTAASTPTVSFIARDITERKALEDQLRQTAKLESIGVLAGGIAHDFNNLLVGILGNASLVRDGMSPLSPMRRLIDDVIKGSERAANLTQQLLAYAGKGKFIIQPLDMSDLAREMVSLIQTSIPRTVTLQLNLASGLPKVIADVAQMQQIVMNLVINAAEAIGDGAGVVAITTGVQDVDGEFSQIAAGKYISLEVQDSGEGMDEETMGKIFDPFFSTKFTGRGLGLSATQGIVRGHKGLIRVESRQGAGSTFRVLLPAADEKPVEAREGAPDDFRRSTVVMAGDPEEVVRRAAAAAPGPPAIAASTRQASLDLLGKVST